MKTRFFALFILAIFLISFVSAEIVIIQNPNALYSMGDKLTVPVKVTSSSEITDIFTINLICSNSTEKLIQYESLSVNGEIEKNPLISLTKGFIGDLKGTCNLKYSFGTTTKSTNNFIISDLINIDVTSSAREFAPEREIIIGGQAKKENGQMVNGFVSAELVRGDKSRNVFASDTVRDGSFALKFFLPKTTASGQYTLKIKVYEKDSKGEITNNGFEDYGIFVTQVPTNLEIFMEDSEVGPDGILLAKAILHDQTGKPISSAVKITIFDERGKVFDGKEIATNEFFEVSIPYNQEPAEWKITASSNELSSELPFWINSVEKVKTEIIDNVLIITNIGNVPYTKTVAVKISDQMVNVNVDLGIGESQKYSLSAPDGTYNVEVIIDGSISSISENTPLTGKAIDVNKSGLMLENNTLIWVIIILILAFFGTKIFRKLRKKNFFGYAPSPGAFMSKKEPVNLKKSSLITRNKAEMELSIKGDQQDVSLVCLRIKNIDKLRESKTDYEPVLQNIVDMAEGGKAYINGAQENIFFIYAPIKTRTFRNEKTAIDFAQKTADVINAYNKLAREKIDFGVSVNHGAIVANAQGNTLKFMSLGTLMNSSKKLASAAETEVLLSDQLRSKISSEIKTQKKNIPGVEAYTVRETRYDERSNEFIRKFMDRMQK